MNDLQRSIKSRIELRDTSNKSRLMSNQAGRKVTIYFLAALIVAVMTVWFGFLGWGAIAMLQWLLDGLKIFWTKHF